MTLAYQQVNPDGVRVFMGTMTGGQDIHAALSGFCLENGVAAASFNMLGGLTRAVFTEFDFAAQVRKPPLEFERPMEILSGHGTISGLDGRPHVHFHLVLSFQDPEAPNGIRVIGGHAAEARAFAVEFTLHAYDGAPIQRAHHRETGLQLWAPGEIDGK